MLSRLLGARRLLLAGTLNTVSNGAQMCAALLTVSLVARLHGQDGLGLWLLALSIIGTIGIAQGGLAGAVVTVIGRHSGAITDPTATSLIAASITISSALGTVALICLMSSAWLLDWHSLLRISPSISAAEASNTIAAVGLVSALGFLATTSKYLLIAQLRGATAHLAAIAGIATSVGAFVALAASRAPLSVLLLGLYLPQLSIQVLAGLLLMRAQRFPIRSFKTLSLPSAWNLIRESLKLSLHNAAQAFPSHFNMIAIATFAGASATTSYGVAFRLFSIPLMLLGTYSDATWPEYARATAEGRFTWLKKRFRLLSIVLVAFAALGCSTIMIAYVPITTIWLGAPPPAPTSLIVGMAVWGTLTVLLHSVAAFYKGIGATNLLLSFSLLTFAANAAAIVPVVSTNAAAGAIWLTILCSLFGTIAPALTLLNRALSASRQRHREA